MMVVVAVGETSACLEQGTMRSAIPRCIVNLYKYFFLLGEAFAVRAGSISSIPALLTTDVDELCYLRSNSYFRALVFPFSLDPSMN